MQTKTELLFGLYRSIITKNTDFDLQYSQELLRDTRDFIDCMRECENLSMSQRKNLEENEDLLEDLVFNEYFLDSKDDARPLKFFYDIKEVEEFCDEIVSEILKGKKATK